MPAPHDMSMPDEVYDFAELPEWTSRPLGAREPSSRLFSLDGLEAVRTPDPRPGLGAMLGARHIEFRVAPTLDEALQPTIDRLIREGTGIELVDHLENVRYPRLAVAHPNTLPPVYERRFERTETNNQVAGALDMHCRRTGVGAVAARPVGNSVWLMVLLSVLDGDEPWFRAAAPR